MRADAYEAAVEVLTPLVPRARALDDSHADLRMAVLNELAEALREIAPVEAHHAELAEEGLARLIGDGQGARIKSSLAYWHPRVSAIFGDASPERMAQLAAWGLRRTPGAEMRREWEARVTAALARLEI